MSHKCAEAIIGKLATDEGFRRRFLEDATGALAGWTGRSSARSVREYLAADS
jgi:hypothetical protein